MLETYCLTKNGKFLIEREQYFYQVAPLDDYRLRSEAQGIMNIKDEKRKPLIL
ncbi:hypothetical protein AAGS61_08790 [Lysinibacillus sp. KU-BSD001]|uniref:hypothetical protein n=1 Tax=Lysinibacillus sp. KU-BSD001 TaxID=3141328 RepID=UPI0036F18C0D